MNINLDQGSLQIIRTLQAHGHEAYLVGGSVRNALLKGKTTDFDITTSAEPEDIMSLFQHTIPTGIQHGTITIVLDHIPYEVTTYRTDGEYLDSRHPISVQFVRDLAQDLKRRDFTINAMAYDPLTGFLVDHFRGQEDLKSRLIRAVGNPSERFHEDALRIIRGIRFAAQLNFNIEAETFKAMTELSHLLEHISKERIYAELSHILMTEKPSVGIELLLYSGALHVIMPELMPMAGFQQFTPHHDKDVFAHTMQVLDATRAHLPLRLAALFHDAGKPKTFSMDENGKGHFYGHEEESSAIAEQVMTRLRVDHATREQALLLINRHMTSLEMKRPIKIKRLIRDFGKDQIDLFFEFKQADQAGKAKAGVMNPNYSTLYNKVQQIIADEEPLELSDLAISGRDLLDLGFQPGPLIGQTLETLLNEVLANPELNHMEYLSQRALFFLRKDTERRKSLGDPCSDHETKKKEIKAVKKKSNGTANDQAIKETDHESRRD